MLAAVAVAATLALEQTTGPTFFGIVLVAVAGAVWLGGIGPAVVATAVTGAGMALALLPPIGQPSSTTARRRSAGSCSWARRWSSRVSGTSSASLERSDALKNAARRRRS
ncbi:MAG: hypothetical protein AB7V62_05685 [Thermoleophilia bacterium]